MRISLQTFLQSENQVIPWETTLSLDELCREISHLHDLKPIQAKGQVKKINASQYQVEGELATHVTYICSRCLREFVRPLSAQWEVPFMKSEKIAIEDEEKDIRPIEEDQIDLVPLIREALLLNIPFAPICQENCKGLCPVCGVDQNESTCDCQKREMDPRWAKLQYFKEG